MRIFSPVLLVLLLFSLDVSAANFVVDTNSDVDDLQPYILGDGTNSLRKCIRLSNAQVGADLIQFNLPTATTIVNSAAGGGSWLTISDPLVIDGYSQAGASIGNPIVELDGAALGRWFALELVAGSAGSTIRGLIINGTSIGIRLDPNTNSNIISGNWIGTDNTGNAAATNPITEHGIRIEGSSNNLIGGSSGLGDRNVIAACLQEGIRIQAPLSSNNRIDGNYIGIGADGSTSLSNRNGVFAELSNNLIIGNGLNNEGNLISSNTERGIFLINCDNFIVKGNTVGLAADQLAARGNNFIGIDIIADSDLGQIGGSLPTERNIISSNNGDGISFLDSDNLSIYGNYIGVAADGFTARPNGINGIRGINSAFSVIGGPLNGRSNLISANAANGMSIYGPNSQNTTIQSNIIGLAANGTTAMGNGGHGIEINENENSQIGGANPNEGNIVGDNLAMGILCINSPNSMIQGNYVGTDATGLQDRGNQQHGILLTNCPDITIGGTIWGARNIISGNNLNGIELNGSSSNVIIKGNFVGLGADGSTIIKNDENAIRSIQDAHGMIVGGPTLVERNVLSGNGQFVVDADPDNGIVGDGVRALGTNGHRIENNYIGTDSTGLLGRGNHWAAVSLNDLSDNNLVIDNLIADNRNEGVWIYNSNANQVFRNIIGEAADGSPLGNWDYGVVILVGAASSNVIGGSPANANIIAHTRGERPTLIGHGVTVSADAGSFNEITFNNIHCNAGKGIFRDGLANENEAAPIILASNSNDINGTGANGRTIHLYRNISADGGAACDCEGEVFIGSTTVSAGVWSFTHNLNLSVAEAEAISATQTTTAGSTSEFSLCSAPILLSTNLLYFEAVLIESTIVGLSWEISSGENIERFVIERSLDALNWTDIAFVEKGDHNQKRFNFQDHIESSKTKGYYYRIKELKYNQEVSTSDIRYIRLKSDRYTTLNIFPNPASSSIVVNELDTENEIYSIVNVLGQELSGKVSMNILNPTILEIELDGLASGLYYFIVNNGERKAVFIKQ